MGAVISIPATAPELAKNNDEIRFICSGVFGNANRPRKFIMTADPPIAPPNTAIPIENLSLFISVFEKMIEFDGGGLLLLEVDIFNCRDLKT